MSAEEGATSDQSFSVPNQLNDLVRDLNLSIACAEVLTFRLKEKYLVNDGVRVKYYRKRHDGFVLFFTKTPDLVLCNNVKDLLMSLGIKVYAPKGWRIFIDNSKISSKCVLLHNGNVYGSVPIAHSTKLKEKYEEIKLVLEKISYSTHKW